eukprot:1409501-Amphidinium_carterae.2
MNGPMVDHELVSNHDFAAYVDHPLAFYFVFGFCNPGFCICVELQVGKRTKLLTRVQQNARMPGPLGAAALGHGRVVPVGDSGSLALQPGNAVPAKRVLFLMINHTEKLVR